MGLCVRETGGLLMSISIVQTCDGCGTERNLNWGYYGQPADSSAAANRGGWIQVKQFEHLCPECVTGALKIAKAVAEQ